MDSWLIAVDHKLQALQDQRTAVQASQWLAQQRQVCDRSWAVRLLTDKTGSPLVQWFAATVLSSAVGPLWRLRPADYSAFDWQPGGGSRATATATGLSVGDRRAIGPWLRRLLLDRSAGLAAASDGQLVLRELCLATVWAGLRMWPENDGRFYDELLAFFPRGSDARQQARAHVGALLLRGLFDSVMNATSDVQKWLSGARLARLKAAIGEQLPRSFAAVQRALSLPASASVGRARILACEALQHLVGFVCARGAQAALLSLLFGPLQCIDTTDSDEEVAALALSCVNEAYRVSDVRAQPLLLNAAGKLLSLVERCLSGGRLRRATEPLLLQLVGFLSVFVARGYVFRLLRTASARAAFVQLLYRLVLDRAAAGDVDNVCAAAAVYQSLLEHLVDGVVFCDDGEAAQMREAFAAPVTACFAALLPRLFTTNGAATPLRRLYADCNSVDINDDDDDEEHTFESLDAERYVSCLCQVFQLTGALYFAAVLPTLERCRGQLVGASSSSSSSSSSSPRRPGGDALALDRSALLLVMASMAGELCASDERFAQTFSAAASTMSVCVQLLRADVAAPWLARYRALKTVNAFGTWIKHFQRRQADACTASLPYATFIATLFDRLVAACMRPTASDHDHDHDEEEAVRVFASETFSHLCLCTASLDVVRLPCIATLTRAPLLDALGRRACTHVFRGVAALHLLPWPVAAAEQSWDRRQKAYEAFAAAYVSCLVSQSRAEQLRGSEQARAAVRTALSCLDAANKLAHGLPKRAKHIVRQSLAPLLTGGELVALMVRVQGSCPRLLNDVLLFTTSLFRALASLLGVAFFDDVVASLLRAVGRDYLASCALSADASKSLVVRALLKLFSAVLQDGGPAFAALVPQICSVCLDTLQPRIAAAAADDGVAVRKALFATLCRALLHHWDAVVAARRTDAALQAFCRSFQQPDLDNCRANIKHLQLLVDKRQLFRAAVFTPRIRSAFLAALFRLLLQKTLDLLRQDVIRLVYELASVDWSDFRGRFVPALTAQYRLPPAAVEGLAANGDTDFPTFQQLLDAFLQSLPPLQSRQ